VQAARERRRVAHAAAIEEILAGTPGELLSQRAAQVALAALMAAVRAGVVPGAADLRTAVRDGLSCTLFHIGDGVGVLAAPTWRVLLPGRIPVFHLPGRWVPAPRPTRRDPQARAAMLLEHVPGAAA
jgi:hypothetical protein